MSKVSIVKCESYEIEKVEEATIKALNLIGGIGKIIKGKDKILLKPNLTIARAPELAVTTHPYLTRAVIKLIKEQGKTPLVGDASGGLMGMIRRKYKNLEDRLGAEEWNKMIFSGKTLPKFLEEVKKKVRKFPEKNISQIIEEAYNQVLTVTGTKEILDEFNIKATNFEEDYLVVDNPQGEFLHSLILARAVIETEILISLPKLKTHSSALLTGCIKNSFGCVPGPVKSTYHNAEKEGKFASMFVDVFAYAKPALCIMDGIVGMEGEGPSEGRPREIGVILASEDAVALDAVASAIIGYEPLRIPTIRVASRRGLGEGNLKKIEIVGERLEDVKIDDFVHPAKREEIKIIYRNE